MKATELRIGNYVYRDTYRGLDIFQVEEIRKTKAVCDKDNAPLTTLEPIPLTEEWLVKLGFEKWYKVGVEGSNYMIDVLKLDRMGDTYYLWSENHPIVSIPYVHQLQNLYFALTGEELTLKK